MKLSEAIQKYSDFEVDEEKLKELIPESRTVYDLKKGDIYWTLNDFGSAVWTNWTGDEDDRITRSLGNAFLTQQEAEFRREQMKVEEELLKLGGIKNCSEFWKDSIKYAIYYNSKTNDLGVLNTTDIYTQGAIYFKTYDEAQNAIEKADENRIKKYLFYAED